MFVRGAGDNPGWCATAEPQDSRLAIISAAGPLLTDFSPAGAPPQCLAQLAQQNAEGGVDDHGHFTGGYRRIGILETIAGENTYDG